jgi:hypothetical protein
MLEIRGGNKPTFELHQALPITYVQCHASEISEDEVQEEATSKMKKTRAVKKSRCG